MILTPTHQCFDDALEFINERLMSLPEFPHHFLVTSKSLILVHGIARGTGHGVTSGRLYAHAWVEEGDECWDAALADGQRVYYSVKKEEYYLARDIQQTTRYTVEEALRANLKFKHHGPWRKEYLALVSNQKRIMGKLKVRPKND